MKQVIYKSFLFLIILLSIKPLNAQNVALDFDGLDDVVNTTFTGVQGAADRTFEAWIYVDANAPSSNLAILDYGLNAAGSRNTFLVSGNRGIGFISGGTNTNISSTPNIIQDNQWTHVAFVLDNGTGYLYFNGSQVGTGNLSNVDTPSGEADLRIGQRVTGGSIPFNGRIDEVRIWDVARTQTEIADNVSTEFCQAPANLVAYYRLNDGVAEGMNTGNTIALDDSGNGNDGTLTNFILDGTSSNWVAGSESVNPGTITTNETISACDSYVWNGMTYSESGMFATTTAGVNGCDTVQNLDLTITQVLTDVTVDPDEPILTSSAIDADNYQWLDCNDNYAIIANENQSTFTASQSGNYAVEITQGNCVDTSNCFLIEIVVLNDLKKEEAISFFPNPTQGEFSIDLKKNQNQATIKIYDVSGKKLKEQVFKNTNLINDNLVGSQGLYFVVIEVEGEVIGRFKIVKE
jgi:hypothetical protein